MSDILDSVGIVIDCDQCGGEYTVAASAVLASQELLGGGYPAVGPLNPAPLWFARFADGEALRELRAAWQHLRASAAAHGGRELVVATGSGAEPGERIEERRAIERWEAEGGRPRTS